MLRFYSSFLLAIIFFTCENSFNIISYSVHSSISLFVSSFRPSTIHFGRSNCFVSSSNVLLANDKKNHLYRKEQFRFPVFLSSNSQELEGLHVRVPFLRRICNYVSSWFTEIPPVTQDPIVHPFTFFVNRKSGGRSGRYILNVLQKRLQKENYCDVTRSNVTKRLEELYQRSGDQSLAICCGGDGTIRWIMDESRKANISQNITFCIIPMGTGNDLGNHVVQTNAFGERHARELADFFSSKKLEMENADYSVFAPPYQSVAFDRWNIAIQSQYQLSLSKLNPYVYFQLLRNMSASRNTSTPFETALKSRFSRAKLASARYLIPLLKMRREYNFTSPFQSRFEVRQKLLRLNQWRNANRNMTSSFFARYGLRKRHMHFNNYFGIGIDGEISSAFAHFREKYPSLFSNSILNKLFYLIIGTFHAFIRRKNLVDCLELVVDGQKINLSQFSRLEGLVFLNINSYAGGRKLWKFGNQPIPYSLSDANLTRSWKDLSSNDSMIEVRIRYTVYVCIPFSYFSHRLLALKQLPT